MSRRTTDFLFSRMRTERHRSPRSPLDDVKGRTSSCSVKLVRMTILALTSLLTLGSTTLTTVLAASNTWPTDSLYQVDAPLETAAGNQTSFVSGSGRVRIVTMFYATCPMACPLTIDTLRQIDAALEPRERSALDMLLLSIDPSKDTAAALAKVAQDRRITDPRWTLARASEPDTRKLAAMLGIQYRKLADGNFDHSSTLILLDAKGRVLARSGQIGKPAPEFVAAVRTAVTDKGRTGS